MPQIVHLPEGGTVEFPDDMSEETMLRLVDNEFGPRAGEIKAQRAQLQSEMEQERGRLGPRLATGVAEIGEEFTRSLSRLPATIAEFPQVFARGIGAVPADTPIVPATHGVLTPETALDVVEFMTPGGRASEGSVGQAAQQLGAEFLSGATSPVMAAAIAAPIARTEAVAPVARYFQGEMLGQVPSATYQVAQAQPGQEQTEAALNLIALGGLPLGIEAGLRRHLPRTSSALEKTAKEPRETQIQKEKEVLTEPEAKAQAAITAAEAEGQTVPIQPTTEITRFSDLIITPTGRNSVRATWKTPTGTGSFEGTRKGLDVVLKSLERPVTIPTQPAIVARETPFEAELRQASEAGKEPTRAAAVPPPEPTAPATITGEIKSPAAPETPVAAEPSTPISTTKLENAQAPEAIAGGPTMPKSLADIGTEGVTKASEIISDMATLVDRPIRIGHISGRPLGIFKPAGEVIRIRQANDIPIASHELAHALERVHRRVLGGGTDVGRARWTSNLPSDVLTEFKALDYDPTKARPFEGFAEFMRHWLTIGDTATVAPRADAWFNATFLRDNPGLVEGLNAVREKITQFRGQGAVKRIESMIQLEPPTPTLRERIVGASRKFVRLWSDDLADLERVEREMTGGQLATGEASPTKVARMTTQGAGVRAREWANDGMTDFAGNKIGPSLKEIFSPEGIAGDEQTAILYAVARRARELHQRGIDPGIALDDANHAIAQLRTPTRDKFAQELANWNHAALEYLKDAGGLTQEALDSIKARNEAYIPFFRAWQYEQGGGRFGAGGKRIGDTPSAVKRIKGSGRDILNPMETMQQHAQQIIGTADKVRIARTLIEMAEDRPTMGKYVEQIPADKVPVQFDINRIQKQLEASGADLSSADLDAILTIFSNSPRTPTGGNIVSFVRDGKRQFFELDPELYRAIQALDYQRIPGVLDTILGKPARAVRLGATGIRAGFTLLTNPIRDFSTMLLQTKGNPITAGTQWVKHMAKQIGLRDSEIRNLWRATGGELQQPLGADRASLRRAVDSVLANSVQRKAWNVIRHPIEFTRAALSFTEAAPRLAEFEMTLREMGWQPGQRVTPDMAVEAANRAAEVTVNFRRGGHYGRLVNQVTAFFNPAVQGLTKFNRAHAENPAGSIAKGVAWITIPSLANWWINKDDQEWQEFPDWVKYGFLNIKVGNEWLRIPQPFEWGYAYGSIPVAVAETLYRKQPQEMTRVMKETMKMVAPSVIPSVATPLIEATANRSFYRNAPIVPESVQKLTPSEQALPYTTTTAKKVSEILSSGGVEVSPAKIEHVLNGETGGLWNDMIGLAERLTGTAPSKEILEPADIPVVGRMFIRDNSSRVIDEFYTQYEHLQQKKATASKLSSEGDPKRAEKYTLTSDEASQLTRMNSRAERLTQLRREYRDATTRKERDDIWKEMINLAKDGLEQ